MQIQIGKGIDNILFGMNEDELINLLGTPDKIVVDDDQESKDLYYYNLKLGLKIEPLNDNRLGWIEILNKGASWGNINPWELDREVLLELLSKSLGETFELDDYGRMESYSFNKNWVELQYQFGELSSFNFGVLYGEDDEPLWPK
jgi:hypothetical protein